MNLAAEEIRRSVVVAMSGGVDSCASALMLIDQGYDVVGISMQVWDYRNNNGNAAKATCCAPADFDDARKVAEYYEFPYYVFDFEDSFEESVIKPFVESYVRGLTPNPCLECNRKVKFRELRRRASALGIDVVATGHYAQIKPLADGSYALFTGKDEAKDQSYFLYAMTQRDLGRTLFPVGALKKAEVRDYLGQHGLSVASKAESQDICFVSGAVGDFVRKMSGKSVPGEIRAAGGELVGKHQGVHNFTVGQRKGLGVSAKNPLYVLNIDAETATVTVGEKHQLEKSEFTVGGVNWVSGKMPDGPLEANVKLRYRHAGVRCRIEPLAPAADGATRARIHFTEEWSAVSPGQAAVFYCPDADDEGDFQVLGGGIIEKEAL